MNQMNTPLFNKLSEFSMKQPISFHVPGHKNGAVFPSSARSYFDSILPIDLTELTSLDDLHAPHGVIAEAEKLAADFFQADHTFFLVGGSTAGNLAMILATCSAGEKIIVQRNSHKSIMNGLELCGAQPIFISPAYNEATDRYLAPSYDTLKLALQAHPDAKAIVLTYPDYFGKTYALREMIDLAHSYSIPVLVDEAHGVHFSLGDPFPASALELGADVVVQSAHKMAPAMTMASYLHMGSSRVSTERVAYFLQMLQSSSPSYPLLASLDLARSFMATISADQLQEVLQSARRVKAVFQAEEHWDVLDGDDPLKITLHVHAGLSGYEVARLFEQEGIYPELATHHQVLFIHGLAHFPYEQEIEKAIKRINEQLIINRNHATIDVVQLFPKAIQKLALSYQEMGKRAHKQLPLQQAAGYVAAEAIIPYPPGIPLILKGEEISPTHIEVIHELIQQGATIQHRDLHKGIYVFSEDMLQD